MVFVLLFCGPWRRVQLKPDLAFISQFIKLVPGNGIAEADGEEECGVVLAPMGQPVLVAIDWGVMIEKLRPVFRVSHVEMVAMVERN